MSPSSFPENNIEYGPPSDFEESQVRTVPAYYGKVVGGSCDGQVVSVVAWKPCPIELARLVEGGLIYLTVFGTLPPHMLTTSFKESTSPP